MERLQRWPDLFKVSKRIFKSCGSAPEINKLLSPGPRDQGVESVSIYLSAALADGGDAENSGHNQRVLTICCSS